MFPDSDWKLGGMGRHSRPWGTPFWGDVKCEALDWGSSQRRGEMVGSEQTPRSAPSG